jgi:hypothetical protein
MSTRGKNINLYLMDGEPNGRIKCGLLNWTGVASEGFVVLKGSSISQQTVKSCPERAIKDRKKFAHKIGADYVLVEDILFNSPSAAAAFVGGASLNGKEFWKTSDGVLLKDLDRK